MQLPGVAGSDFDEVVTPAAIERVGKCLAHELKTLVGDDPDVRVLYRNNPDETNRADFGLNELLYDVCICRTAEHPSSRGGRALRYFTGAVWLVESEFARDSAQAVNDFQGSRRSRLI